MKHKFKILFAAAVFTLLHTSYAPPVTQNKAAEGDTKESDIKEDLAQYMEYHRYLKEVIQALESDSDFRTKLEKAEENDIKTGKIAHELDFVSHNIRTQLDEIKRREMERLRHLATREFELTNDIDTKISKVSSAAHLDKENPHTFEIEDLKRLIAQTTADLAEADRKRRDEFKQYELEKEFSKHQKMDTMDDEHKKEFEEKLQKEKEQQKQHAPLHHPGSKQQLEEVWEKQDHMEQQDFDPKVFFMMHDVDGNGVWDADEVKALFVKELDKMYARGDGAENLSDPRERYEEMERMREHVFSEADSNRDGLIDYKEFLVQTRREDFEKDQGWQGLDENQIYTPEEYQAFEHQRIAEQNRLNQMQQHPDGQFPPQYMPPGQHPNPQYQQGYPQQGQYQAHPNDVPQHPGQQQAQYHPGQPQQAQYAGHPQQAQYAGHPQQAQYAGQPQQAQYAGHPQQAQYAGQPQQAQYAGQPQQAQYAGQPQQAQYHAGQLPQGHIAQPQQQSAQGSQGVAQPPPVQPQPVQAQPAQAQPAQAQPIQAQPIQAQPIQAQPIQAQPAQAQAQPAQAQPAHAQPPPVHPN